MKFEADSIQFAASTHMGLQRNDNEDCYAADAAHGLWLVADGVGGHSSGEVAAAIVKATVELEVLRGETLSKAILLAHSEVLAAIARDKNHTRMGSTVVALSLVDGDYTVAWVGDSRAYLWDGGELVQLTVDHSHVRTLVDMGMLSHEDMDSHPDRHALTQSLGVSVDMKLALGQRRGQLHAGQQILLCSDGLTDELTDTEIAGQLAACASPQEQVDGLVNAALRAGGRDNITVIMVGSVANTIHPKKGSGTKQVWYGSWQLALLALVVALGLFVAL